MPAEALPKEDVGPKLPPGGWRGNTSQQVSRGGTSLPDIKQGNKPNSPIPQAYNKSPPRTSNSGFRSPQRMSGTGGPASPPASARPATPPQGAPADGQLPQLQ